MSGSSDFQFLLALTYIALSNRIQIWQGLASSAKLSWVKILEQSEKFKQVAQAVSDFVSEIAIIFSQ